MTMEPQNMTSNLVLILDFGSQYTHLITRRIRKFSVFSLCISGTSPLKSITDLNPRVIILSGGPHSVHLDEAPSFPAGFIEYVEANSIFVLGICYGLQLIVQKLGGVVKVGEKQEYGRMEIVVERACGLFGSKAVGDRQSVWMSHGDEVAKLPDGFSVVARSQQGLVAAIENPLRRFYGLQYHPEEKLFSSKNRTEASLGKKLKIDMLPEIEKVHKRKGRLLKKQHREALLLDSFLSADGLATGRSLRDRKPVTYTFDDFDRSINEAIKITKRRQPSPEPHVRREVSAKPEASANGKWSGPSQAPQHVLYDALSPKLTDYDENDEEHRKSGPLDRSNRRRQRPQRYSVKEFVEAVSDNEADFDSDDDIVGEAVYDEEYLRSRKQRRKVSSSSEGDEEYCWDEENAEDEEEEDDDSLSSSEDTNEPHRSKEFPTRSRRGTKLRSVDELQSGLRRSRRATQNRINYRQYEMSESEADSVKPDKSNASEGHSGASNNVEYSMESQDSQGSEDDEEMEVDQSVQEYNVTVEKKQNQPSEKTNNPGQEEFDGVQKRRFLDLNELAPGIGFDDGPSS